MAHPISRPFPDPNDDDDNFDLAHIFISREQQLDLFDIYLTRWQKLIFNADPDLNTPLQTVPLPNNKLQYLVVLLYGHGGFGKSTLRTDVAEHAIMQALEVGLPPVLLTPLYWLEVDAPDAFM